jgi:hypothetical protein
MRIFNTFSAHITKYNMPKISFVPFLFSLFLCFIVGKSHAQNQSIAVARPITHEIWGELLQKYVSKAGRVNYADLKKDTARLNQYLKAVSTHHPNSTWSKAEEMAFWINAYNAFTVKLVLDYYPIKSIKDIKNGIPFVNTVWDIKFITIEGKNYDLNNLEHGMLRAKFDDPRVHFALNCASFSCPKLQNEAFTAEKLETQLDAATRDFLNDGTKNKITSSSAQLSKIFQWYRSDFTKKMPFNDFIHQYSKQKIGKKTKISYLEYIWTLNE